MQEISCYGRQLGKWEPAPRHCSLIPGLPNEMALAVLARVPRAFHGGLRYVCRAWRDALHSHTSHVTSIRKELHIAEEWVILLSDHGTIIFFDPLHQRFSKRLLLHKPQVGRFAAVFGTSGNLFVIYEADGSGDSFRFFDTSTMLWHRKSHYFPLVIREKYTAWVVVDDHMYVVGGEDSNSREALSRVDRFDITAQTWDLLPNMHVGRARAAVVPLQGRLCVIGGQNYATQQKIYSGEIWDAEKQEWILGPELWPREVFDNIMPVAATVMGTIYALQPAKKELFGYNPMAKLWISLGVIPLADYPCRKCGDAKDSYCKRFIRVLNELWMVWQCSRLPGCRYRILACVPTLQAPSLSWRRVPITKKFDSVSTVYV